MPTDTLSPSPSWIPMVRRRPICSARPLSHYHVLEGEPIVEPEVDLSSFLEKQRISDPQPSSAPPPADDDDDIDTSIAPVAGRGPVSNVMKGKIQQVEWDSSLEELSREKAAADATRGALWSVIIPK